VHEAACPVIAVLDVKDRGFINEAAKRGIFAYVADGDSQEMQSSIDIVLRRFAEYHNLEGAFGRRAITERAKGILMERHDVDEQTAFTMLRDAARRTSRKLVDIADAVVTSRSMLQARAEAPLLTTPLHLAVAPTPSPEIAWITTDRACLEMGGE
jgi:AmiR/NasT family two-component response regulator